MQLVKYLGLPSSGSIADVTHSHNRGGQYTRARNGRGGLGEIYFAGLASAWQSLTEDERQRWINFSRERAARVDPLGQVQTLSGFGWFCRQNLVLHNAAGSTLQAVPVVPADSALWGMATLVSSTMTAFAWDVVISFPQGSSGIAVVSSSGVVTAGTMSPPGRGKWWQNVAPISWGSADVSPLTISLGFAWVAHFGALPLVGQWVFVGLRSVRFDQAYAARQQLRIQVA